MSGRKFPAVYAFTLKGKFLVLLLRFIGLLLSPFFGRRPLRNFEESPDTYGIKGLLYFSYKYYYSPPERAEEDSLETHFRQMKFQFPDPGRIRETITLSSGGDLMPYEWLTPQSCSALWEQCGEWFFGSDIVFANLETPVDPARPPSAVPEVMLGNMQFNASEELFKVFNGGGQFKGFDVLSTANNHSFDMGAEGVRNTIRFLRSRQIAHTGTSESDAERWDCPVITHKGIRVAFVAATFSLNHLKLPRDAEWMVNTGRFNRPGADLSLLRKLVENARTKADFVVLSLHTGNAYQAYPSIHTVQNLHRIFAECGPDLILGSHPHNPQPLEQVSYRCPYTGREKKGIAVYSQGDFVAYDIFTWCHLHLGLRFHLSRLDDGEVVVSSLEVQPQYLNRYRGQFRFIPLEQAAEVVEKQGKRNRREYAELKRFWQAHIVPAREGQST